MIEFQKYKGEAEERFSKLEIGLSRVEDKLASHATRDENILDKLDSIQSDINRMKGFTAGVAAVFGVIGAVGSFLWDKLSEN